MKLSTTAAGSAASAAASSVDMRLLEQLFDHTPDLAFLIKDAVGCYLAVNHSLLEHHGLRTNRKCSRDARATCVPATLGANASSCASPARQSARPMSSG